MRHDIPSSDACASSGPMSGPCAGSSSARSARRRRTCTRSSRCALALVRSFVGRRWRGLTILPPRAQGRGLSSATTVYLQAPPQTALFSDSGTSPGSRGGETDCDVRGGCNRTKLEHKRASAHSRVAAQAGTTKDRCGNQALGSAGATGVSSLERKRKPE